MVQLSIIREVDKSNSWTSSGLFQHWYHNVSSLSVLLTLGVCARVMVVILCVCEYVCYRITCYIPHLQISSALLHGSLWCLKGMHRADFAGNTLFSSSAVICFHPLSSTLPDKFSVDMMNISGQFQDTKCVVSATAYIKLLLTKSLEN